ncbi:unnamed protein product [Acanthocheilonema viteae]|uniref:PDZ domain-containing protein n=1 Tax=Acanthocheilonema viteae TaxID=6277 RepID=A0A498S3S9_ACAVI|nr:unnamed protein product [Acanthocheilonema viteae]
MRSYDDLILCITKIGITKEVPSPSGFNLRLTVPKKHYSVQRNDSLQFITTPVFEKAMMQKKTPSSQGTVLTVAGLFVVGITLVLSGIIVLCQIFAAIGATFPHMRQLIHWLRYIDAISLCAASTLQPSEEKERHEEVIIETNNEGLGMRVDENLYVIEISKQGPCDGKLLPGDHIIQIGDRIVQTVDEAREAIEAAGATIRIVFDRGLQSIVQNNIPEQYESLFKRREGFTYHYVQINYVKGCKFGLGIKHFQNNVIVSRIDPGSIFIYNSEI